MPDLPPAPPLAASPDALRRLQEILHRYQVPPAEAEELLRHAMMEVAWREGEGPAARDDRLVRSVERRAHRWREDLLRRRLAEMVAETNGNEEGRQIDPTAEAPGDPGGRE
jgi:hypothetical protein